MTIALQMNGGVKVSMNNGLVSLTALKFQLKMITVLQRDLFFLHHFSEIN